MQLSKFIFCGKEARAKLRSFRTWAIYCDDIALERTSCALSDADSTVRSHPSGSQREMACRARSSSASGSKLSEVLGRVLIGFLREGFTTYSAVQSRRL